MLENDYMQIQIKIIIINSRGIPCYYFIEGDDASMKRLHLIAP